MHTDEFYKKMHMLQKIDVYLKLMRFFAKFDPPQDNAIVENVTMHLIALMVIDANRISRVVCDANLMSRLYILIVFLYHIQTFKQLPNWFGRVVQSSFWSWSVNCIFLYTNLEFLEWKILIFGGKKSRMFRGKKFWIFRSKKNLDWFYPFSDKLNPVDNFFSLFLAIFKNL